MTVIPTSLLRFRRGLWAALHDADGIEFSTNTAPGYRRARCGDFGPKWNNPAEAWRGIASFSLWDRPVGGEQLLDPQPFCVGFFGIGDELTIRLDDSPRSKENHHRIRACVRLLSQTVATLPLFFYTKDAKGRGIIDDSHPLYRILHDHRISEWFGRREKF